MKKKLIVLSVLTLVCAAFAAAQNLDAKVKKAVDDLSSRINRPIAVSISPLTIADSDTPTVFSKYLWNKINQYAVNNPKYRVVQANPGSDSSRSSNVQKGTITGTYQKIGNVVEVTLFLSSDANNQGLASAGFTIPAAELESLGLAIGPENAKTEKEVKEREVIFSPPPVPERRVTVYKIGDKGPAGGFVFYDKGSYSNGWRYLEVAPKALGKDIKWGLDRINVEGTEDGVGSGKKNTEILMKYFKNSTGTKTAVQRCDDYTFGGFSDWYLPSLDELNLVYKNIKQKGIVSFNESYWSSSHAVSLPALSFAWFQNFSDGSQNTNSRDAAIGVLAVRSF